MNKLKKGDMVHVDFISNSHTNFSGKQFKGVGFIDRSEDGYIIGRLINGTTFMCNESDAKKIDKDFICLNRVKSISKCLIAKKGTVINNPEYSPCFCGEYK